MNFIKTKIFLIDGLGAIVTAVILSFILPIFQVGVPKDVLNALAAVAILFGIYSLTCFVLKAKNTTFLKGIIFANLLYCVATALIVFYFYKQLNWLTIAYFVSEILVIVSLISFEIWVLKIKSKSTNDW